MRRIISGLICLLLVFSSGACLSLSVSADKDGNYTYTIENEQVTITRCKSTVTGDLEIPSELGGYPVTSLGDYSFFKCSKITSVVIPDGVKSIGYSAFGNCTKMTSVSIPDSVEILGYSAFLDCAALKSVVIPESVTEIGYDTFKDCAALSSVTISSKINSIPTRAFENCSALTSVIVPNGVKSIDFGAFRGCSSLGTITIPDTVTSFGEVVFDGCGENLFISCSCDNEYVTSYAKENDIAYTQHKFLEYVTVSEPTCTEQGEKQAKCENCDIIDIKYTDSLGHTEIVDGAVESTCTSTGLTQGSHCSVCDEVFVKQQVVNKKEHNYSYSVTKEETCSQKGIVTYMCACGDSYTVEVDTLAHTEVVDESVAPTCTETGLTEGKHCSVCSEVIVAQEVVQATGHKLKTVNKKAATYFAKGYTGDKKCSVCNKIILKGKTIAKLVLKKPTFKLTGAKGKFTVKYTKVTGATGFELKYKLGNGKYKTIKVNTKKSMNKVIKKLKKGKYTVQVRAYVKSGSKIAYSSWASAKKVTVK